MYNANVTGLIGQILASVPDDTTESIVVQEDEGTLSLNLLGPNGEMSSLKITVEVTY